MGRESECAREKARARKLDRNLNFRKYILHSDSPTCYLALVEFWKSSFSSCLIRIRGFCVGCVAHDEGRRGLQKRRTVLNNVAGPPLFCFSLHASKSKQATLLRCPKSAQKWAAKNGNFLSFLINLETWPIPLVRFSACAEVSLLRYVAADIVGRCAKVSWFCWLGCVWRLVRKFEFFARKLFVLLSLKFQIKFVWHDGWIESHSRVDCIPSLRSIIVSISMKHFFFFPSIQDDVDSNQSGRERELAGVWAWHDEKKNCEEKNS